jgi:hypothetical protein
MDTPLVGKIDLLTNLVPNKFTYASRMATRRLFLEFGERSLNSDSTLSDAASFVSRRGFAPSTPATQRSRNWNPLSFQRKVTCCPFGDHDGFEGGVPLNVGNETNRSIEGYGSAAEASTLANNAANNAPAMIKCRAFLKLGNWM